MANFFVDKDAFGLNPVIISGDEANHMIKVLRMKEGEFLTLFDGDGNCAEGEIEKIENKTVYVKVIKRYQSESEPQLKITLFQAIPKNPKLDLIIQKATELGVTRIVPVNTKRIVAKIDKEAKIERLQKIAHEAAKQCGRAYIPPVTKPVGFEDALKEMNAMDAAIIPYECERDGKMGDVLPKGIKTLGIIIGPEGGFEESEVKKAMEAGVRPVTLGKRILRTETAGLIASAIALYIAGDME